MVTGWEIFTVVQYVVQYVLSVENNTWIFPVSTGLDSVDVQVVTVVLKHSNSYFAFAWSLWREGLIDAHVSCFTAIQESKEHEIDEGFADVIEKGWLIKEGANDDSRRKRRVNNPKIICVLIANDGIQVARLQNAITSK